MRGAGSEPYKVELKYDPVFSESCGCGTGKSADPNRVVADIMEDYRNALNYEEYVNHMENEIAADPAPGNVHNVLKKYCPGNAMICLTEELNRYFHGQDDSRLRSPDSGTCGFSCRHSRAGATRERYSRRQG